MRTRGGEICFKRRRHGIFFFQLIPPGKGLYEIELDTPLETGEYEGAQLQYRCIDMEDTSIEYNGANMALTLRVS